MEQRLVADLGVVAHVEVRLPLLDESLLVIHMFNNNNCIKIRILIPPYNIKLDDCMEDIIIDSARNPHQDQPLQRARERLDHD